MATIFVDESGDTGSDLLNPDQPVFVLASHNLDESEAQSLKDEFFHFVKAESLKYSQLSKRGRSQRALLSFLKAVDLRYRSRFKTFVIHKPFALHCKLVDHVVEVSMRRGRVDLYERGGNLALANFLYLVTKQQAGREYLSKLLRATYRLFETDDKPAAAGELVHVLDEKTGLIFGPRRDDPLGKALSLLQYALLDLGAGGVANLGKNDLPFAFSTALALMSKWSSGHGANIDVVHDESSQMLRQFEGWVKITSDSVPAALVGMDRRTIRYPIGVKSTRFEPDGKWAGLQIADLVAGAMAKALARGDGLAVTRNEDFEAKLVELFEDWILENSVWPEAKFTPKDLGTDGPKYADPFEFHARVMGG